MNAFRLMACSVDYYKGFCIHIHASDYSLPNSREIFVVFVEYLGWGISRVKLILLTFLCNMQYFTDYSILNQILICHLMKKIRLLKIPLFNLFICVAFVAF